MFRIGIIELGFTCALIALAFVIPVVVMRGYARLNERLKSLEDKVAKKK